MRKMFIGGLSHEANDDALRAYFTQWGPVVDAIVIRDPTTKQSRGFGFVTFATIASLEAAMINRPHVIAGKTVFLVNLFFIGCKLFDRNYIVI
ncbi:unnamed protein product [Haemonchus placei]|uniref:RRM domain-containing protein n=1 Tax=Haemonchus placei TaxID=6290 RepID=A0A0N4WJI9_HAEPC|nr:unnamed protein product [Haemonchus placei]